MRDRAVQLIGAGISPLEMRLAVSRHLWAEATDQATGQITDLAKAKEAADFAEAALPYTSQRLSATELTGPNGGPIEHRIRGAKERLAGKLAQLEARETEAVSRATD